MKNAKFFSLILIIIGVVCLSSGLFLSIKSNDDIVDNKESENNEVDDEKKDEEDLENDENVDVQKIDYDYAYNTAISLYGGEGKQIEVVEEDNRYVINVVSDDGKQIFYMDKTTGVISEESEGSSS